MSVYDNKTFENCNGIKCDYCGDHIIKWINMDGKNYCHKCAHKTMRRLFEDLIEFSNPGKRHISLIGIMMHGDEI